MECDLFLTEIPQNTQNYNTVKDIVLGALLSHKVITEEQFEEYSTMWNVVIVKNNWFKKYFGKCVMSFDNLAIEQLKIERLLTKDAWSKFYMGDDFTFTMYIDAVEEMYAPTSRNSDRKSFNEFGLLEYFQTFKG